MPIYSGPHPLHESAHLNQKKRVTTIHCTSPELVGQQRGMRRGNLWPLRRKRSASATPLTPRLEIEDKRHEAHRAKFGTAPKED